MLRESTATTLWRPAAERTGPDPVQQRRRPEATNTSDLRAKSSQHLACVAITLGGWSNAPNGPLVRSRIEHHFTYGCRRRRRRDVDLRQSAGQTDSAKIRVHADKRLAGPRAALLGPVE